MAIMTCQCALVYLLVAVSSALAFQPHSGLKVAARGTSSCHSSSRKSFVAVKLDSRATAIHAMAQNLRGNCRTNIAGEFFDVNAYNNLDDLLRDAIEKVDSLNDRNLAAIWSRIPRLLTQRRQHSVTSLEVGMQDINLLVERTMNSIETMQHKELTTTILGIAKIVQNIKQSQRKNKLSVHQQSFCEVLLVENSLPKREVFDRFAIAASTTLVKFDTRCLSNLAYAYALLGYDPSLEDGSTLFEKIAQKAKGGIKKLDPQGISNIVWALAVLEVDNPSLFQSIGDSIATKADLNEFLPQHISNISWAYAKVNMTHPRLFKKIGDFIVGSSDLSSFNPQNLANIVWSYATTKIQHPELFKTVGDHIVALNDIRSFKPKEISSMLWSFASADVKHHDLFEQVTRYIESVDNITHYNKHVLENIARAYEKAHVQIPDILKSVQDDASMFGTRDGPSEASKNTSESSARKRDTTSSYTPPKKRSVSLPLNTCRNVGDILILANQNLDGLPPHQTAATWSFISKLISQRQQDREQSNHIAQIDERLQIEQQVDLILKHTMKSISTMGPKDLTTIILSMAKIVKNVRNTQQQRRADVYQHVFFNVILDNNYSLRETYFSHCAKAANDILPRYEPRYLSNVAYAFALLGYNPTFEDGTTLLANVAKKSIECAEHFNAQDISNMLWAYASLKISNHSLFRCLGNTAAGMNKVLFAPQNFANIVWSFAKINQQHTGLFMKFGDAIATSDLSLFKPQDLTNIVWAYASTNTRHPRMFREILGSIIFSHNLRSFRPQALGNLVWAYATFNVQQVSLFTKIGDEIVAFNSLNQFDAQAFSNIVWSYATAEMQHSDMFQKIGDAIVLLDNLESFRPQALANIVWAYAKINFHHPSLFEKISEHIVQLNSLETFQPQELANIEVQGNLFQI